jgi:hypothetical protein
MAENPRQEPPPPRLTPLHHLVALAGYACLSIVVTWPTVLHFSTEALGELYIDRVQNIWNLWWVKVALLDYHTNPFHTDLLLYPQGADLYFHTLSLPSTLITLIPQLLWGLVAAYNFGMLFAITLSGYAGWRLVTYLTGSAAAGVAGGIIIGFNALMQSLLKAQINVLSFYWFLLCIEFYLRTLATGRRSNGIWLGVFFALAVLTVGYFEILLLVFFALHTLWTLATAHDGGWRQQVPQTARRMAPALVWGGGTAAVLLAPYLLGAWRSLQSGLIFTQAAEDSTRTLLKSFDLLSFVVPNSHHWLLGEPAPWWADLHLLPVDSAYLGVVTVGLAGLGVWQGRRRAWTWFWGVLALIGAILSLGPILHINGQETVAGVQIGLPFQWLQQVPLLNLVRAPQRFCFLTFLGLAVLAGTGLAAVLPRLRGGRQPLALGAIIALLILEMPLAPRYTEPMTTPESLAALGQAPGPGAVLELPLTQHGGVEANRMLYQTVHGRPITSAYLSRVTVDPYAQACSPFQVFTHYDRLPAADIVAPGVAAQLSPALLADNGIGFLTVYKQGLGDWPGMAPLPPAHVAPLQDLAARLGTPLADDAVATTYRVRPATGHVGLFLQLGPDWHSVEQSAGAPFRWMNGGRADLCVFSPAAQSAPLQFQATSFAGSRHLQVWLADRQVFETVVPADGALHALQTPPLTFPAGPQAVRFVVPEGSASPADLGQGTDTRQLSVGFSAIQLGR